MTGTLTADTQAILLLTAPLITGADGTRPKFLTLGDYKRLARRLRELGRTPADLVSASADSLIAECESVVPGPVLRELLGRGFQLAQAMERWRARAIWVISRADEVYPRRLKARLQEDCPPILYGCGDVALLASGGLAIVGSRDASDDMLDWTGGIGRLAARSGVTVVSGGARGVDDAAVRSALDDGGRGCAMLADSLEKHAISRSHRQAIVDRRFVLVSPYDPAARFNVGHAMGRNKLIYALADGGLVVNSALESGGTWAGAIEQLRTYRWGTLWVRQSDDAAPGNAELLRHGGIAWPGPATEVELRGMLAESAGKRHSATPLFPEKDEATPTHVVPPVETKPALADESPLPAQLPIGEGTSSAPADRLYEAAKLIILDVLARPVAEADVATALGLPKATVKQWLARLVDEGVVVKDRRPVRYRLSGSEATLPIDVTSDSPRRTA